MTTKTDHQNRFKLTLTLLSLLSGLVQANAAFNYWDPTGLTVSATPSGTWEGTNWAQVAGGSATLGTFQEGILAVFTAGTSGSNSFTVTANSNHTLAGIFNGGITGTTPSIGLIINGPGILSFSGLQGFSTANSADNTTILSVLDGTGQLENEGGGSLFLYGTNTFSGGVLLGTGAGLNFNNNSSFGTGPITWGVAGPVLATPANDGHGNSGPTGPLTISNSVVTYTSNCTEIFVGIPAAPVTFAGPWTLNSLAGTTVTLQNQPAGTTVTISGAINGPANLTKAGAGTLVLSGASTYSGKTTVTGGILSVNTLNSVSGGSSSGSLGAPVTVANGTISIGSSTTSGTLIYTGAGETTDRVLDLSGTTGGAVFENDGTGPVTFSSASTASGAGAKMLTLQGSNTGANTIGGKIVNSSSATSLTKAQAGAWTLSGVNTYTGGTTISAGTLTIGGAGQLGSGNYASAITNTGTLVYNSSASQTFGGVISSTGTLIQDGPGLLTLTGTNTFSGKVLINSGTVALSTNGALTSATIVISPGTTYDVSGLHSNIYTLGNSASITAIGSGGVVATLNGIASGTVSFGARPITLSFTPTSFSGDSANPALVIAQSALTLNSNAVTVTNASATPLGPGAYMVAQVGDGTTGVINGAPSPFVSVKGAGLVAGYGATLTVSNGDLYMIVTTLPAFSNLTASQSIIYGTPTISVSGTLSASGPIYPALGEPVTVTISGNAQATTINDNSGDFSLVYNSSTIPANATPATITYSYTGDASLSTALDTSTTLAVSKAPLTVTANNQTKTYGQGVTFSTGNTNFTSSGLLNGQTIGSVTLAVTGSGGTTNAPVSGSPYTITPSAATGGTFSAANYTITYATGLLTVNPALLTVKAVNVSRAYGATNPAFSVTYSNFVNNQTLVTSDVRGNPVLTTEADTNSPAGTYEITNSLGTLTSTNYSFNLTNGTLTVTNALSTNVVSASQNPAPPGVAVTFTATVTALAPSLAVPTNSVQFVIDGTPFGAAIPLTNGSASFVDSSLSHGHHTIEADYSGDTNALGALDIEGSTNVLNELINTAPVAGPATYSRQPNTSLTIPVSVLLTNATDADGDTITLLSVSAVSANGGSITNNGTLVTYTPPVTNANVTDTFGYVVQDSFGATNAGTVTITVLPSTPVNFSSVAAQPGGVFQLNLTGAPGQSFLIEAASNLSAPISWTILSTNTADTNGVYSFTDLNATNYPIRFYRTALPQ